MITFAPRLNSKDNYTREYNPNSLITLIHIHKWTQKKYWKT